MQFGARLDIKDKNGSTPLHLMCDTDFWKLLNYQQVVQALDVQDNKGNTPLIISLLKKKKELSQFLLQFDQNFDLVNKN